MKLKRLLARLEAFLSAEERQRLDEAKAIKKVLAKLKQKQRKLRADAAAQRDPAAAGAIEDRLSVVIAQRRKGVAVLRELKKKRA